MSTDRARRVTAADVAQASGVSRATVSYVLNGTPGQKISEATRERVRRSAEELGYVPNSSARALVRGTSSIALIDASDIPFTGISGFGPRMLAQVFASRGYVPIIDQLGRPAGDHAVLLAVCATVAPAVVVTTTELPPAVRERVERAGVRNICAMMRGQGVAAFVAASAVAAEIQVSYLASLGHRSIAYAWPGTGAGDELVRARRDAAEATAAARGITVQALEVAADPAVLAEQLAALVADGVSAIAAYSDDLAIALLAAASRTGVAVPGSLAVIGADDVPLGAMMSPPLTTIRHRLLDVATAGEMVDQVLAGAALLDVRVAPRVVRRESA